MSFLQLLINTVALGAAYALVALGFVWVLNATNAVNFAHGDMVMTGGFASLALAALLPVPGILLLPLVLVLMAVLGLVFSGLAYFPLKDRPPVAVFISTIALGIVLTNAANALFRRRAARDPTAVRRRRHRDRRPDRQPPVDRRDPGRGAADRRPASLFARTQFGRKLRATRPGSRHGAAVGIPVHRMIALTFALATALAGAAGLLLSNSFFVSPADGMNYMVKAYIAVTIGGWGSIPGAVAGAFLIALFDVMLPGLPALLPALNALPGADWLFSQTVATILLYLLLLAILLLRPQGLFGEAAQRRA
ncbi:MAG: branched-chain amino acid ABC transporter permease [Pseudomonadota bacterium]